MRISKPVERWFDVPGDPDGAKIKIKPLSPREVTDIYDQAFKQTATYAKGKDGKYEPTFSQETDKKLDRELTWTKSIVDWKNFYDHDDKPMKCTNANVIRAAGEIEGFATLIKELRDQLDLDIATEREEQRKNSQGSASARKK